MTGIYSSLPDGTKRKAKVFTVFGPTFLFLGILLVIFTLALLPIIVQVMINSQVLLVPGTLSYEQWQSPTPKVYKIITAYNITNPWETLHGGTPKLEALGPYYYREYREKIRISIPVKQDGMLWFGEKKWYKFDNTTTNANRTGNDTKLWDPTKDVFTTINLAYVGVAYNLTVTEASKTKIMEAVIAAAVEKEQTLTMNRTVGEVIFGYEDPFLKLLQAQIPSISSTVQCIYNMSSDDISETSAIDSGKHNHTNLGQYSMWKGMSKLPWWKNDMANTINGTEGLFFSPNLDKDKTLSIFTDDMFRSIIMEYEKEEEVDGMKTFKYRTPAYSMLNATNNPNNDGFYSYGPDGLCNLTAVVSAPIMMSKASFIGGAPWLYNDSEGLPAPDPATMDTNIWVEPSTGALVQARKILQVNVMISKTKAFPKLDKLRDTPRFVPMALVHETGGMDDDLQKTFKNKVFKSQSILKDVFWVLAGLCLMAGGVFLGLLALLFQRNRNIAVNPPGPHSY